MAKIKNLKNKSIDIASVDAKDLYIATHYIDGSLLEYSLKNKNNTYNLRRFINSLDYSLDSIKLNEIYTKRIRKQDFTFKVKDHLYTTQIINVTFKYSVKSWNQVRRNVYVKLGYNYKNLTFSDCIAIKDNEVVGIILNENILNINSELPQFFSCVEVETFNKQDNTKTVSQQYVKVKEPNTVMNNSQLRNYLYNNGFMCDGIKYCRMKRSSGSARVGKCLFINEKIFKPILNFSSGAIRLKQGQEVDLAAYEAYISLTSSSIIDTITIKPENILIVDDYESVFEENVVETRNENGELVTEEKLSKIANSIWDGQSLIDKSIMGKYSECGMLLLRNLMFKSCCFNTNIQKWFKDNNITDISQLNGFTYATNIEDIKLITTPSSIKYLKFGKATEWLNNIGKDTYSNFGIVKYDKKTHFFDGKYVQTHYQLINTLQLSYKEMEEFLSQSLDFAQKLKDNPAVVRYYIKYPDIDSLSPLKETIQTKNDIVYNLMAINNRFSQTKFYNDFLTDLLKSWYKNLKNGHILVEGNYSTLFGNPIEMLQQSIGKFDGSSQVGVGHIYSRRFKNNELLLGSRSPHVTIGNIFLAKNKYNDVIDKYFNLTQEIVVLNSINENTLQRLSGADFDSDTMLITNNKILVNAAKKNYEVFKTPTSKVTAKKVKRYYTADEQSDLDVKTAVNKIGEIVNLSQELNSLLWNKMHLGATYEDVKDLYYDICQLDVMSGIEIDKAKKEFSIDNAKELRKIRDKYKDELNVNNKKIMPHFFAHISRQKGYYNSQKKEYTKYHTSMDYLQTIVNSFRIKTPYNKNLLPFISILDNSKYYTTHVNEKQIKHIFKAINNYIQENKYLYDNSNDVHIQESKKFSQKLFTELVQNINEQRIGYSTLYKMLSVAELPENKQIKNTLFKILWQCQNQSFRNAIIQSADYVDELIDFEYNENVDENSSIKLYDFCKKVTKNRVNSQAVK